MYGVSILPLIRLVSPESVIQKWYADDGNAVGSIEMLKKLLMILAQRGAAFGYHEVKCYSIKKRSFSESAKKIFSFLIREGGLPESAVTDDREYEYDYLRSQAVSDSVSVNEYIELGTSIQKKIDR